MIQAEETLARARGNYDVALRTPLPLPEIRARFEAVSDAYDAAITGAVGVERIRPGTRTSRISELRELQQRHLLEAPLGVRSIATVRPSSHAALGPHIPGIDFEPATGEDSGGKHRWGIDLSGSLK